MTEPHRPDLSRRAVLAGVAGTGLAGLLAACSTSRTIAGHPSTRGAGSTPGGSTPNTSTSTSDRPPASTSSRPAPPATRIKVSSMLDDGTTVGVGMPIVLLFDTPPTDAAAFVKAVTVKVNGTPVRGAWYWSKPYAGEPTQAHFRTQAYWPANATIDVALPIGGLSAGKGLAYADALDSLRIRTGDKRVTHVDGATETATVEVNDKVVRTMRASLGKSSTPTYSGIKLVMQKGEDVPGTNRLRPDGAVHMQNTAHTYSLMVDWSVRITESGEYMHAAPWNSQIGHTSTSDGCTNLSVEDAKWYYHLSRIGDIVIHRNTGGGPIPLWNGFTDWNIPWGTYQQGGLLKPT